MEDTRPSECLLEPWAGRQAQGYRRTIQNGDLRNQRSQFYLGAGSGAKQIEPAEWKWLLDNSGLPVARESMIPVMTLL